MADSTCRFVKINIFGVINLDNRMVNDICARVPRITFARVPRIIWARVPRICLCIQTVSVSLLLNYKDYIYTTKNLFKLGRILSNYEDSLIL